MLHISSHPLVHHRLVELRDFATPPSRCRRLVRHLTLPMVCEATARLATKSVRGTTPLAPSRGRQLARPVVPVPILRAGLGMIEGALELLPDAKVGHLGMARHGHTLLPNVHYSKYPAEIAVAPGEGLDDCGYILPGPGDAGDRLYDTSPA